VNLEVSIKRAMQADRQFWNEDVETLSPEDMQALQWRRLKKQLQYNFENSVYYREEKFQKAGLTRIPTV
jgi:phenylacetate-coenzyme A ligase PaaK-like adenylate-forming protein